MLVAPHSRQQRPSPSFAPLFQLLIEKENIFRLRLAKSEVSERRVNEQAADAEFASLVDASVTARLGPQQTQNSAGSALTSRSGVGYSSSSTFGSSGPTTSMLPSSSTAASVVMVPPQQLLPPSPATTVVTTSHGNSGAIGAPPLSRGKKQRMMLQKAAVAQAGSEFDRLSRFEDAVTSTVVNAVRAYVHWWRDGCLAGLLRCTEQRCLHMRSILEHDATVELAQLRRRSFREYDTVKLRTASRLKNDTDRCEALAAVETNERHDLIHLEHQVREVLAEGRDGVLYNDFLLTILPRAPLSIPQGSSAVALASQSSIPAAMETTATRRRRNIDRVVTKPLKERLLADMPAPLASLVENTWKTLCAHESHERLKIDTQYSNFVLENTIQLTHIFQMYLRDVTRLKCLNALNTWVTSYQTSVEATCPKPWRQVLNWTTVQPWEHVSFHLPRSLQMNRQQARDLLSDQNMPSVPNAAITAGNKKASFKKGIERSNSVVMGGSVLVVDASVLVDAKKHDDAIAAEVLEKLWSVSIRREPIPFSNANQNNNSNSVAPSNANAPSAAPRHAVVVTGPPCFVMVQSIAVAAPPRGTENLRVERPTSAPRIKASTTETAHVESNATVSATDSDRAACAIENLTESISNMGNAMVATGPPSGNTAAGQSVTPSSRDITSATLSASEVWARIMDALNVRAKSVHTDVTAPIGSRTTSDSMLLSTASLSARPDTSTAIVASAVAVPPPVVIAPAPPTLPASLPLDSATLYVTIRRTHRKVPTSDVEQEDDDAPLYVEIAFPAHSPFSGKHEPVAFEEVPNANDYRAVLRTPLRAATAQPIDAPSSDFSARNSSDSSSGSYSHEVVFQSRLKSFLGTSLTSEDVLKHLQRTRIRIHFDDRDAAARDKDRTRCRVAWLDVSVRIQLQHRPRVLSVIPTSRLYGSPHRSRAQTIQLQFIPSEKLVTTYVDCPALSGPVMVHTDIFSPIGEETTTESDAAPVQRNASPPSPSRGDGSPRTLESTTSPAMRPRLQPPPTNRLWSFGQIPLSIHPDILVHAHHHDQITSWVESRSLITAFQKSNADGTTENESFVVARGKPAGGGAPSNSGSRPPRGGGSSSPPAGSLPPPSKSLIAAAPLSAPAAPPLIAVHVCIENRVPGDVIGFDAVSMTPLFSKVKSISELRSPSAIAAIAQQQQSAALTSASASPLTKKRSAGVAHASSPPRSFYQSSSPYDASGRVVFSTQLDGPLLLQWLAENTVDERITQKPNEVRDALMLRCDMISGAALLCGAADHGASGPTASSTALPSMIVFPMHGNISIEFQDSATHADVAKVMQSLRFCNTVRWTTIATSGRALPKPMAWPVTSSDKPPATPTRLSNNIVVDQNALSISDRGGGALVSVVGNPAITSPKSSERVRVTSFVEGTVDVEARRDRLAIVSIPDEPISVREALTTRRIVTRVEPYLAYLVTDVHVNAPQARVALVESTRFSVYDPFKFPATCDGHVTGEQCLYFPNSAMDAGYQDANHPPAEQPHKGSTTQQQHHQGAASITSTQSNATSDSPLVSNLSHPHDSTSLTRRGRDEPFSFLSGIFHGTWLQYDRIDDGDIIKITLSVSIAKGCSSGDQLVLNVSALEKAIHATVVMWSDNDASSEFPGRRTSALATSVGSPHRPVHEEQPLQQHESPFALQPSEGEFGNGVHRPTTDDAAVNLPTLNVTCRLSNFPELSSVTRKCNVDILARAVTRFNVMKSIARGVSAAGGNRKRFQTPPLLFVTLADTAQAGNSVLEFDLGVFCSHSADRSGPPRTHWAKAAAAILEHVGFTNSSPVPLLGVRKLTAQIAVTTAVRTNGVGDDTAITANFGGAASMESGTFTSPIASPSRAHNGKRRRSFSTFSFEPSSEASTFGEGAPSRSLYVHTTRLHASATADVTVVAPILGTPDVASCSVKVITSKGWKALPKTLISTAQYDSTDFVIELCFELIDRVRGDDEVGIMHPAVTVDADGRVWYDPEEAAIQTSSRAEAAKMSLEHSRNAGSSFHDEEQGLTSSNHVRSKKGVYIADVVYSRSIRGATSNHAVRGTGHAQRSSLSTPPPHEAASSPILPPTTKAPYANRGTASSTPVAEGAVVVSATESGTVAPIGGGRPVSASVTFHADVVGAYPSAVQTIASAFAVNLDEATLDGSPRPAPTADGSSQYDRRGARLIATTRRKLRSVLFFTFFATNVDEPSEIILSETYRSYRHNQVEVGSVLPPVKNTAEPIVATTTTGSTTPPPQQPAVTRTTAISRPEFARWYEGEADQEDGVVQCCLVAPAGKSRIHDNDTDYFDGNVIAVVVDEGGCNGDSFRLITPHEQQIHATCVQGPLAHPPYIIEVEPDGHNAARAHMFVMKHAATASSAPRPAAASHHHGRDAVGRSGSDTTAHVATSGSHRHSSAGLHASVHETASDERQHIGVLEWTSSNLFPGAENLHIRFDQSPGGASSTVRLVPTTLATYVLNCIAYCSKLDTVRSGERKIKLTISDELNPIVGEARLCIDVQPPLLLPASRRLEVTTGFGPNGSAPILVKITAPLRKDDPWTKGYLDICIVDHRDPAMEWLSLKLDVSSACTFEVRTFVSPPPPNTATSSGATAAVPKWAQGPGSESLDDLRAGREPGERGGGMLIDNSGTPFGRLVNNAPGRITVLFTSNAYPSQRTLEHFLKSVFFVCMDIGATSRKEHRHVRVVGQFDCTRAASVIDVDVKLQVGGRK